MQSEVMNAKPLFIIFSILVVFSQMYGAQSANYILASSQPATSVNGFAGVMITEE